MQVKKSVIGLLTVMTLLLIGIVGANDNVKQVNATAVVSEKRTFKLGEKLIVPLLMGGLMKVAGIIPVIAIVSTFIGTISLISSKAALLISLILGIRALLSLIPSPEPKDLTHQDLVDLQSFLDKQAEKHHHEHWDTHDPHSYVPVMYYHPPTAPDHDHDHAHQRMDLNVAQANAIVDHQIKHAPNGRIGVKITKTVVKHNG